MRKGRVLRHLFRRLGFDKTHPLNLYSYTDLKCTRGKYIPAVYTMCTEVEHEIDLMKPAAT